MQLRHHLDGAYLISPMGWRNTAAKETLNTKQHTSNQEQVVPSPTRTAFADQLTCIFALAEQAITYLTMPDNSLGADVGTMVMAGGAAAAINETFKAMESEHNVGEHLLHAGLGAAAVGAGYEMVRRASAADSDGDDDEEEEYYHHHHHDHHRRDSCDHRCRHTTEVLDKDYSKQHDRAHRSPSVSSDQRHKAKDSNRHKLHLAEETVGAWGLIKNAMGDQKHKGLHVAEEVLGAVGVRGEVKDHQQQQHHHHD
jgi:hypothetical protein